MARAIKILPFLDIHGWPGPSMDSATHCLHKGHIFSSIKSATILRIKLLCLYGRICYVLKPNVEYGRNLKSKV